MMGAEYEYTKTEYEYRNHEMDISEVTTLTIFNILQDDRKDMHGFCMRIQGTWMRLWVGIRLCDRKCIMIIRVPDHFRGEIDFEEETLLNQVR